ncbi:hypothetical protein KOR34_01050 [Posidoniimonas corsicana]|uniref:Sigma-70, region 4 n=1 Tax=Posidoniimonas corsicana TaxID=1938618 RepID=A0A5C5VB77_9BACT|nr:hypothetical protein [Posidoniimonas corsicana]TWT35217.1 hypothetical protein KOR34_01050 [Posidoniimonas corsicana]
MSLPIIKTLAAAKKHQQLRRQREQRSRFGLRRQGKRGVLAEVPIDLPARGVDPADAVAQAESTERRRSLFEALLNEHTTCPDRQRRLTRRLRHGETSRAIAADEGTRESTLRSQVRRARIALGIHDSCQEQPCRARDK